MFFPIRNLPRSSWGIRPPLIWDTVNLFVMQPRIHRPYRPVLSSRIVRCNRYGRSYWTRPKLCTLFQLREIFVILFYFHNQFRLANGFSLKLTAEGDIDVIESDVNAQSGDNFFARKGSVTAYYLFFCCVPSATATAHCVVHTKEMRLLNWYIWMISKIRVFFLFFWGRGERNSHAWLLTRKLVMPVQWPRVAGVCFPLYSTFQQRLLLLLLQVGRNRPTRLNRECVLYLISR